MLSFLGSPIEESPQNSKKILKKRKIFEKNTTKKSFFHPLLDMEASENFMSYAGLTIQFLAFLATTLGSIFALYSLIRKDLLSFRKEMKDEFAKLRQEIRGGGFANVRQEMKEESSEIRGEAKEARYSFQADLENLREEMQAEFSEVKGSIHYLNRRLDSFVDQFATIGIKSISPDR